MTVAITLLPAYASLVPITNSGFGTNTTIVPPPTPPTHEQKDAALKIAATSPLCAQYNAYPNESWSCTWAGDTPDGHTVLVSKELDGYFLDITVDLNTGSIVNADYSQALGFAAPADTYAVTSNTDTSMLSSPSIFKSMPSIGAENDFFNIPSTNINSDNTGLTALSGLTSGSGNTGLSIPLNMFSTGLNAFPSLDSETTLPTQAQKDDALKIAATSPLCQQYNVYPDESWDCQWLTSPHDGSSIIVSKRLSDGNTLEISVDLNSGTIVNSQYVSPWQ